MGGPGRWEAFVGILEAADQPLLFGGAGPVPGVQQQPDPAHHEIGAVVQPGSCRVDPQVAVGLGRVGGIEV